MSSPTRWLGPRRKRSNPLLLEDLETRVVLSVLMPIQWHDPNPQPPDLPHAQPTSGSKPLDFGSQTPVGYTPAQIRAAYGIDNVTFGTINGDGAGQTIAIVNAYDDPAFVNSTDPNFSTSDLAEFDQAFGLPDPPSFTKYNETGQTTNLPGTDPAGAGNLNGNWEMEEASISSGRTPSPRRRASTWSRRATTPTMPTCSPPWRLPPSSPACRWSR